MPRDLLAVPAELTMMEEADPADWLESPAGWELGAQVLRQQDERCIVLLHAENTREADDEDLCGIEDAAGRFNRFNR